MSSWSNSKAQQVGAGSSAFTVINFNQAIVPGNNPIAQAGNHTYSYHVNVVQSVGTIGPLNVTAVLAINGVTQEYTRSFTEIDTGAKASLTHSGELQQLQVGDEVTVRVHLNNSVNFDLPSITTSPNRCTLTLRRVTGQGT